jgi:short subunit dehydrogenase-like uncharacterized protein
VKACLARGTHYLDITGEIPVFEAIREYDQRAREASVMLLPGDGVDVGPSDCLAARLQERLPDADRLTLAFAGSGGISRGTARTAARILGEGVTQSLVERLMTVGRLLPRMRTRRVRRRRPVAAATGTGGR